LIDEKARLQKEFEEWKEKYGVKDQELNKTKVINPFLPQGVDSKNPFLKINEKVDTASDSFADSTEADDSEFSFSGDEETQ
jgi:hypothetical protein